MVRSTAVIVAVGLALATPAAAPGGAAAKAVTWTGWFSDHQCARVRDGEVRPNNTACVRRCLNEGAKPVFISEQAKAIFDVTDPPSVAQDVGYRVEVTGTVNESVRSISITSVKRLSEVVPTCALPKRGGDRPR
jgi:hypothetical protein